MTPTAAAAATASTHQRPATSASAAATATDPLGNESTFLTLLVSQLQNQDPLNPTDSNQFVSQLTSFSQLEQLINIDQNTTPAAAAAPATVIRQLTGVTGI